MKAVIFDMDGVIINSEPFWERAEKEVFTSLGVKVTDELAKITKRMTTTEVTKFWFEKNPWKKVPFEDVEQMVVYKVMALIKKEGCEIPGVQKLIAFLKKENYRLALATNSPYNIIPVVLKKMGLEDTFDAIVSAEFELEGKPNPAVYLTASQKLNIEPENCFVIEDSVTGMQAGKAVGMNVIALTNENINSPLFDHKINSFLKLDLDIFK